MVFSLQIVHKLFYSRHLLELDYVYPTNLRFSIVSRFVLGVLDKFYFLLLLHLYFEY